MDVDNIPAYMALVGAAAPRSGRSKKTIVMRRGDMVFEGRLPRDGNGGQDIFMERMQ